MEESPFGCHSFASSTVRIMRFLSQTASKQREDSFIAKEDSRPDDIVIPVMGPTGSGKSTFIANVLGEDAQDKPQTSVSLDSCTQVVQHYIVDSATSDNVSNLSGRRIILVDTPGFDDTGVSDFDILRRVSAWLENSYREGTRVGAVIYIYPVYPGRYSHNDRSNLKIFSKLCGKNALTRVTLATSRWDEHGDQDLLERREADLQSHWRYMLECGASTGRLGRFNDPDHRYSAATLLKEVVSKAISREQSEGELAGVILDLQQQVVLQQRELNQTGAARELKKKLDSLVKEYESMGDNPVVRAKARDVVRQLDNLKISVVGRLKLFLLGN
ncbi:hypothetical protein FA15DRAFT_640585 [Coprinopsis marcescibilis]|uniref:AIG1-type G domain-containing protein n=1 Tax=Coprinopsis marcescibilis TaxID=230819 RepID=A0A5C3KYI2_COPMA|nr:hypothetical protein FA15DRAFT_640585 [Coprinopsis marcescibilis]